MVTKPEKSTKSAKTQKKPKNHKRTLKELRTEFREAVKAKNEKRAWTVAKLYHKRKTMK